jgi:glycosyltransferase involved in cell wall biosynthesis
LCLEFDLKILTVLTYYRPHTSGLTIYAERLARAFVNRGHEVTVLTTQYDKSLPLHEEMDGVQIVRLPVLLRVSKGVLAPSFGWAATKYVWNNDVVHLHLPQFDAPGVAFRGRLFGKPVILTYHCDLHLPSGIFNRMVNFVVNFQNCLAGTFASHLVTYTSDYAENSGYLLHYRHKLTPILPPVTLPLADNQSVSVFAEKYHVRENTPVIGMAARFASEKGVEVLLDAMPAVLEKFPHAQVLFAGQYKDVLGEQAYLERLMPKIMDYHHQDHWHFLGILNPQEMSTFYGNLDALVVPSLNSTEAFGLVQIEAMLHGVPCVASSLPGVRQPVLMHGMGEVAAIGDANQLAASLIKIFSNPKDYVCDTQNLANQYNPDAIAAEYEKLFEKFK